MNECISGSLSLEGERRKFCSQFSLTFAGFWRGFSAEDLPYSHGKELPIKAGKIANLFTY